MGCVEQLAWQGGWGSRGRSQASGSKDLAGGPEPTRILVVDDEDHSRSATARMLRYEGFEVLEARSGKEALVTLESAPNVQLAIIDIVMPDMNGLTLADRLPGVAPHCGVILMTGYTGENLNISAAVQRFPILLKPFTVNQLVRQVSDVLQRFKH